MDTHNDHRTGANGQYTSNGRPHGSTSLTPFLVIEDTHAAIAFYRDVFGARVVDVTEMDGVVAHAELDFGHGKLQLAAPLPDMGLVPAPSEGSCYSLGLYCSDVDAVAEAAQHAGAVLREAPATFVSGDRYASLLDPFGVRWSVMTRIEDISEAESARRVAAWAAEQSAAQDSGSPA